MLRLGAFNNDWPMNVKSGFDAVIGDASGYPVTKIAIGGNVRGCLCLLDTLVKMALRS